MLGPTCDNTCCNGGRGGCNGAGSGSCDGCNAGIIFGSCSSSRDVNALVCTGGGTAGGGMCFGTAGGGMCFGTGESGGAFDLPCTVGINSPVHVGGVSTPETDQGGSADGGRGGGLLGGAFQGR